MSLSEDASLFIRYYVDKEPTEDDHEHLSVLQTELSAMQPAMSSIVKMDAEFVVSMAPINELDRLDGSVFTRRETNSVLR